MNQKTIGIHCDYGYHWPQSMKLFGTFCVELLGLDTKKIFWEKLAQRKSLAFFTFFKDIFIWILTAGSLIDSRLGNLVFPLQKRPHFHPVDIVRFGEAFPVSGGAKKMLFTEYSNRRKRYERPSPLEKKSTATYALVEHLLFFCFPF